jgi:ABC-type transporter Mla subunit MlaD
LAADLEKLTNELEQLAADVVGELARIDPGMAYQIGRIEEEPETRNEEGVEEFIDNIQQVGEAAEPALEEVRTLADIVAGLGTVSKRLRPVTRRMSTALGRIAESSQVIQDWARRLDSLDESTA